MSQGTTAVAAASFQFSNRSNKNNDLAEKSDYMGVIKPPRKHIFISLWLHAKYMSTDCSWFKRCLPKPNLTVCYCKGNCWKSFAAAKLHLQYIKNELLLIMCNSWFSSLYFFRTSWTLLSLSVHRAKHCHSQFCSNSLSWKKPKPRAASNTFPLVFIHMARSLKATTETNLCALMPSHFNTLAQKMTEREVSLFRAILQRKKGCLKRDWGLGGGGRRRTQIQHSPSHHSLGIYLKANGKLHHFHPHSKTSHPSCSSWS